MKHLVLKLDDIGRDSSRPVIDVVLWALQVRLPISVGMIGVYLRGLPRELIDLFQIASKAGCLEIWNHGFRHIRYDQVPLDTAVEDLVSGHKAILDVFGIAPAGFGFPFNRFTEESVEAVRQRFPFYFIYESDFPSFKLLSPEYNALADGQPRTSYFFERLPGGDAWPNLLLQAHPPRWTKAGLDQFVQCVKNLVEARGYVCVNARDAIDSASGGCGRNPQPSPVWKVVDGVRKLSDQWNAASSEYALTLSNFKSYFLARFKTDAQKNWHQVRSELFPFRPKTMLDIGCGLGNWSLPFWLSGECNSLILNDVNPTIVKALSDGLSVFPVRNGISIRSNNLIAMTNAPEHRVDFVVSANTFNYLDAVEFFRFAQDCVVSGGRLLLMLQTPAFNRLRYRLAFESRDRSVGAEVLGSDFSMLLRKSYGMFPDGTRHAFPSIEVNRLANMFDFTLLSQFAPYGESKEDGEDVYECLLFKKSSNMRDAISGRPEWLSECKATIGATFGSKAFHLAGIPLSTATAYFDYNGEWIFDSGLALSTCDAIRVVRTSIDAIRRGSPVDSVDLRRIALTQSPLADFADRVRRFEARCS